MLFAFFQILVKFWKFSLGELGACEFDSNLYSILLVTTVRTVFLQIISLLKVIFLLHNILWILNLGVTNRIKGSFFYYLENQKSKEFEVDKLSVETDPTNTELSSSTKR